MLMTQCQSSCGHYMGNASVLYPSSQMMVPTAVFHPSTTTCYKHYILLLIHDTEEEWGQGVCLWAQYQYSSGHCMGNASILDPSSQITEPTAVFHPSTMNCNKLYILSLIHNTKGCSQTFMYISPISV
jgi:hypothetical protein